MTSRFLTSWILLGALTGCAALSGSRSNDTKSNIEVREVPPVSRGADDQPRHRLLVLPFLDERTDRSSQTSTEVSRQAVVRELLKTHQFVVISNDDFPQDPKKYLTEENEYDMPQISKLASAMGVAAVVEGKILSIRAKRVGDTVGLIRQTKAQIATQVRLRVYAGKNGKEIMNEVRAADVEATTTRVGDEGDSAARLADDPDLIRSAVRKAFVSAIPNLTRAVEKLSWEGRVAMVAGERVYINAGRLTGIQVGDILKVTEEGDDVYDPETGRFIGTAPGRLKGTVEVVSYFGKDGAVTVIHSGSGFQENDRIELY